MVFGLPLFPGLQLFGRSRKIEELCDALRASGIHPNIVPDAILITIIKLLKKHYGNDINPSLTSTASFFAYLLIGRESLDYSSENSSIANLENRLTTALNDSKGLDYELLALTYHSGLINPLVRKEFKISVK
tara:strand:- start:1129 stop:1524 length:396 start_codon:yes stop_codon:yes gene_type:complete